MAYVYRHIRLDKNEPFYIGIGTSKFYNRAKRVKNRNSLWQKIYDKTKIKIEIILDELTIDEAKEKEKELIKIYGRINNNTGILSNLTDGGEGAFGLVISDEHRAKIAESNRRRIYTKEDREKISIRHTGRKHSEESKLKQSNSLKNSQKFKNAIKENCLKFIGYKHSEEAKYKISKSKYKKVIQLDLNGNIIKIWDCLKDVKNAGYSHASDCCRGLTNSCKGYIWKYINSENISSFAIYNQELI